MVPESISLFFAQHQTLLWLCAVALDLGMALLMFRLFGKQGLYAIIVLDIMLANLVGAKLTMIMGMNTSLGVIIYSGIYFATDLLSERYGKREANRAVLIGFAVSVIIVFFGQINTLFLPTPDPEKHAFASSVHESLNTIFGFSVRFVFGSLLAYLISQTHDVWMFHLLKKKTKGKHLWLRNNLSTMTSQALDTLIYAVVVWWGIFDLWTAFQLAMAKYFIKIIIAAIDTPFIYWAREWRVKERDWFQEADSEKLEDAKAA